MSNSAYVFARVAAIRQQAERLLRGAGTTGESLFANPPDELDQQAVIASVELRLTRLRETFELTPLAVDALVCLVAAEFDPVLRLLQRAVQREHGLPWLELGTIAELLELEPPRVPEIAWLFAPSGSLRRWALALVDDVDAEVPAVSTRVKVVARVAQYLVGRDALPPGITRVDPGAPDGRPLVAEETAAGAIERARWARQRGEQLVIEITGPDGGGKRHFARALAAALEVPLVIADLASAAPERLESAIADSAREARLAGALRCLARWDAHAPGASAAHASDDAAGSPAGPRRLPPPLARALRDIDGVLLLTAAVREPLVELAAPAVVHVDLRFPTPRQRGALLAEALAKRKVVVDGDVDFAELARRFALPPARLEAAAQGAVELVRQRDPSAETPPPVTAGELREACLRQLHHDLSSLASRVTVSHRWEDLVIPVEVYHALCEMIAYVRHSEQVYERWGFAKRHGLSQGVSALFAGPPGTGKTMCASVMAHELDMELFQVDLSRVVSKWIGETEKNLARVFDEAERSNAIILFDEADSLFARRTEVKSSVDRYANLEVNFLLQRMEAFSGITILTTNFEDTIDTAFKRRLTFRVRFEKPDADARAALWSKVFPASCELAGDVAFERLASAYDMTGANIRNAAVRAAFMAAAEGRAIDMASCVQAAERECREMGLLVSSAAGDVEAASWAPAREARPPEPAPERARRDDGEAPPPARAVPREPLPRRSPSLVPVTHPRR